jgi:hypothetical protein
MEAFMTDPATTVSARPVVISDFAAVALQVTRGSSSVYVPSVSDALDNSRNLKPRTAHAGAWSAAEKACGEDLGCAGSKWQRWSWWSTARPSRPDPEITLHLFNGLGGSRP